MAINDLGTRNQYTATAAQTVFPYTFEAFDKDDLTVEQNGTILTEGTQYTVSGVGFDAGGNVTLLTGATAGDILTIYRDMALERLTDYQNSGDFLASEVNSDFDRIWAALQQNKNGGDLAIRANIDDAILNSTNTTLTTPALRAGKALGFTSTGAIDYLAGTMPVGTLRQYSTLTALVADVANTTIGDIALLTERTTGNGGGAKWKVVDATTVTENGFDIVTGDAARSFQLVMGGTISIAQFGAVADGDALGGGTNNTAAIQKALNQTGKSIIFNSGYYSTDELFLSSDTKLIFSPGCFVVARPGYGAVQCVFVALIKNNIIIEGNNATVMMQKAEYTTGESRHCFRIYGSTNIYISSIIAKDSGGDGFSVGGAANETCRNISLVDCVGDNNRRQGLSITNVIGCRVIGGEYKNTTGINPQFGIDIEPNELAGYEIQGVEIVGVRTEGNTGGGISLALPQTDSKHVSIDITGHSSYNDGQNGGLLAVFGGLGLASNEKMTGSITYSNSNILSPQTSGIVIQNWTNKSPKLKITNVEIVDVASNISLSDTSPTFRCGIYNYASPGADGSHQGEFDIENVNVYDSRVTVRTAIPIWFDNQASPAQPCRNVSIKNLTGNAWVDPSLTPIFSNAALTNQDVLVKYNKTYYVSEPSSISLLTAKHIGSTIENPSALTYNLPLAANAIGSVYSFYVATATFLSVGLLGTDIIEGYAVTANAGIRSNTLGSTVTVESVAANTWRVTNIDGVWAAY